MVINLALQGIYAREREREEGEEEEEALKERSAVRPSERSPRFGVKSIIMTPLIRIEITVFSSFHSSASSSFCGPSN